MGIIASPLFKIERRTISATSPEAPPRRCSRDRQAQQCILTNVELRVLLNYKAFCFCHHAGTVSKYVKCWQPSQLASVYTATTSNIARKPVCQFLVPSIIYHLSRDLTRSKHSWEKTKKTFPPSLTSLRLQNVRTKLQVFCSPANTCACSSIALATIAPIL